MEKCIIIIPIYKKYTELEKNEIVSLNQIFHILGNHLVCIVAPHNLESADYKKFAESLGIKIQEEKFDNHFFTSTRSYNKLLLSDAFYNRFRNYNYMLIYQLDAYVFRDELLYWCEKGYDYIGAPWFKGYTQVSSDSPVVGTGNGGFSLRNIQTNLKILKKVTYLKSMRNLYDRCGFSKILSFARFINLCLFRFTKPRTDKGYCMDYITSPEDFNEDTWWAVLIPQIYNFKVAPLEDATKFSFEANPKRLYNENGNQLPFGCHAWEKYEPEFWGQFITIK